MGRAHAIVSTALLDRLRCEQAFARQIDLLAEKPACRSFLGFHDNETRLAGPEGRPGLQFATFAVATRNGSSTSIRDVQTLASVRVGEEVVTSKGVTGFEGYEALDLIRQTILPPRVAPHCSAERNHRERSPAGPLEQRAS
jgi:hypothetical protein